MRMVKPAIFLIASLSLASGISFNNETLIKNSLWTATYSLSAIKKRIEEEWNIMCYKTMPNENVTIEQCSHACVIKFTVFPNTSSPGDYANKTSYHCQDLNTYPPNYLHVCSENESNGYPLLKTYFNKRTLHKTQLYCCDTDYCNAPGTWNPIEPQRFVQTENMQIEHYDIVLFLVACIMLAALTIWPFFKIWQVSREDKWLEVAFHSKLERAVQLMESHPQLNVEKMKEKITGQLKFNAVKRWFEVIHYYKETSVTLRRKVAIPRQKTVNILQYQADGWGHALVQADRHIWVRYADDTTHVGRGKLMTVLEHGPYAFNWKPTDLVELFDQAKELFYNDPIILKISLPVVVIGDIRGHYADLWRWLQLTDVPPKKKFLFLGGLIDPDEPGSLDCLALVAVMKLAFPGHVFLLRGISESMAINFGSRYGSVNDSAVQSAATRLCRHLPIACRIHMRILAVHSGISHLLTDYACFNEVRRPFDLESMPLLARHLIFNEPTTKIKMYRENSDTLIGHFGFQAVTRLCKEVGFDFIIRSRHHIEEGIMWNERGRLISLWSSPGKLLKHLDRSGNETKGEPIRAKCGAILCLNSDGKQSVLRLEAQ